MAVPISTLAAFVAYVFYFIHQQVNAILLSLYDLVEAKSPYYVVKQR